MNAIRKYIPLLLLMTGLLLPVASEAQNGLKIKRVFDDYGSGKGVVMVQLTNEKMEGFDFSLYKSMTIKNNPSIVELIRQCIEEDQKQAEKVKKMESGSGSESKTTTFLLLPRRNQFYRLVLFKSQNVYQADQTTLLVYIETKSKPDDMLNFILKKK